MNTIEIRSASRSKTRRSDSALVAGLAQHVAPPDRALLQGIYQRGMTSTAMALAMAQTPRSVQKRVRRLLRRLGSAEFRYVVRTRHAWPAERRAVAEAIVLRGQTQQLTAAALNLSLHRVRQHLCEIRALCLEGVRDARSNLGPELFVDQSISS